MPTAAASKKKAPLKKHIGVIKLAEDIAFQPATLKEMKIRYENGVGIVDNVKILGYKSRNKNRRYLPEGIKTEMYEGKEVYVDHPDPEDQKKPRSIHDKFGWIEGVTKTKDGVFAKHFKFNPKHPIAESFKFWAEKNPRQVGFSQNAFGDVYEAHDGELVEEVTEVRSIDLVADPATTKGLYEAFGDENSQAVEKGEGHTGYDGDCEPAPAESAKDKTKLAPSSPGPSSAEPTEKMIKEDEEEKEESDEWKDTEGGREKPKELEEDESELEKSDEYKDTEGGREKPEELEEDDEDGDDASGSEENDIVGQDADLGTSKMPDSDETVDEVPGGDGDGLDMDNTGAGDDFDISPEIEAAAQKIFGDANLDFKTKLKRLAHLLKVHPHHVEESVKAIKDLPTAKRVARKVAGKYKLTSVKLVLEALDKQEVAAALRKRKARMNELLSAARLPDEVVTESFKEELLECKDERRMQSKIEDRRKLVEACGYKPKQKIRPRSAVPIREQYGDETPKAKRMTKEEQEKKLNEFEDAMFAGVAEENE